MIRTAIAFLFLLAVCTLPTHVASENTSRIPSQPETILGTPTVLPININKMLGWYNSNGNQEYPAGLFSGAGMFYPKGTSNIIYASGIMWGGRLRDGQQNRLHVNGQYYSSGMRQGAILGIRTGMVQSSSDSSVRLYRIRRDFRKTDLRQDAAETYRKNPADVTNADIAKLRSAYAKDWAEWPWQYGAPFYDTGYPDQNRQLTGAGNGQLDWGEDQNHNGYMDPGEDVNKNGVLDGETPGYADADMVLWYVCNDIIASRPFSSQPIGMELQGTIWAYNRTDPLANVVFKQFRLIYKGLASTSAAAVFDSVFITQTSDPDIGDATDDYAGCDTTLNLGYVYNATAGDRLFNGFSIPPPAAGIDLIQGPVVRGIAGQDLNKNGIDDAADYALVNLGSKGPGFINLPMTSFVYFDRHTRYGSRYQSPPGGNFGATGWYQTFRGLPPSPVGPPDPDPLVNPTTLAPSKFWVSGDPSLQYGWLDGPPTFPGDREFVLASGPFRMAIGDTQEVVFGVVAGLGTDNVSSISVMKYNDKSAQVAFNNGFHTPKAPAPPRVHVESLDGRLLLDWGLDSASIAETEVPVLFGNYGFQGYNVYQIPDGATELSRAVRIATFDLDDGVRTISQEEYDPQAGEIYLRPVQFGTDNGLQHSLLISRDTIWDRPLVNGQRYYFAVTAYNYTPDHSTNIRSVESAPEILAGIPESNLPGTVYPYHVGDTVTVKSLVGNSDAVIVPVIYNPRAQTGASYLVRFDTTTSSKSYSWGLTNATTGKSIYSNITDLSGRTSFKVAEGGFDVTISIPPVGLRYVLDEHGDNAYGASNPNPSYTVFSQKGTLRALNGVGTTQRDYEIRFDGRGSYAIRMLILNIQSQAIKVPFSVWDVGRGPDDVPVQIIPSFRDSGNTPDTWNLTPNGIFAGDTLFRIFEPIHITNIPYPTSGDDSAGVFAQRTEVFRASQSPDESGNALWGIEIADKDHDGLPPPAGSVIKFIKFHEIRDGDVKEIRPLAPVRNDANAAKAEFERINVVPNPYYGEAVTPTGLVKHRVTFTHLPARATVRIFNLAGLPVTTLVKDDAGSQFLEWNLQSKYGLQVGSGVYIAYIELPDFHATKTLKFIIIQGRENPNGY